MSIKKIIAIGWSGIVVVGTVAACGAAPDPVPFDADAPWAAAARFEVDNLVAAIPLPRLALICEGRGGDTSSVEGYMYARYNTGMPLDQFLGGSPELTDMIPDGVSLNDAMPIFVDSFDARCDW